ncbi:MAG TPA: hypothetical protein VHZ02_00565 [Acidimicrobiales bacterium]|jgi:hypothetical protein|nr:hypothetical protein [Acidimicrobiales bacterium]
MTSCVDQEIVLRQLNEKLGQTANPRVRAMLERVREHAAAETTGDLAGLMDTLNANPAYHFWGPVGDDGPKGRSGVESFYSDFVQNGQYFLEYNCDRIVADEDCVVLEAVIKAILPGPVMATNPMAAGMDVKADRHYLLTARNVTFWPFDQDVMLVGEDSYSGGPYDVRLLEDHELPDGYRALFTDAIS